MFAATKRKIQHKQQGSQKPGRVMRKPASQHERQAGMAMRNPLRADAGNPATLQRKCDDCGQKQTNSIQAKLTVGAPNDPYEKEADQVADRVMRMPLGGSIEPASEKAPAIQAKTSSPSLISPAVTPTVSRAISSPGSGAPLSDSLRSRIEPVLGADLSGVAVHSDGMAQQAANDINAKAFTHGSDIFLGGGQSADDVGLMAHEATHVVQQSNHSTKGSIQRISLGSIGSALGSAVNTVSDIGSAGIDLAGDAFDAAVDFGRDKLLALVRKVSPGLADIIERGPLTVIREFVEGTIGGWLSGLLGNFDLSGPIDGIKNWFGNAFLALRGLSTGDDKSCSAFAATLDSFLSFAKSIVQSELFQGFKSGLSWVHNVFSTIISFFVETSVESVGLLWSGVKSFAGTIGEWIGTIREYSSRAWNWVAEKLGFSDGGFDPIGWIKGKVGEVWGWIKEDVGPAVLDALKTAGKFIYKFSGLEFLGGVIGAGRSFISAIGWLWSNRNDPDLATKAAEDPAVKDTILPRLLSGAKRFGSQVESTFSSLSQQASEVVESLALVIENMTGLPILNLGVGLVSYIKSAVGGLREWVATNLPVAIDSIKSAVKAVWNYVKPIIGVVSLLALGLAAPPLFPVVVAGLIGSVLWRRIPTCYKSSIINFLLDIALTFLTAIPDLPLFGPLWSLLKPGLISFLTTIRKRSNDEKIKVVNKVVEIMLFSGADFVLGYVQGFLKGVWEAISDPFIMLWQLGKGLFSTTEWLANTGKRFFGDSTNRAVTATGISGAASNQHTPQPDQALAGRVVGMANELRPPAEQVKDDFPDAAQEYFSGSDNSGYESLREKLGDAWDSAQSTIEGQGEQLANKTVEFLLAPDSNSVVSAAAATTGKVVGWLAGTIVTEIVIAILSAGMITAAKGVMKAVTWIANLVNKAGDIFGALFRVVGFLGRKLATFLQKAWGMFAKAGRGAINSVLGALGTITNKLKQFSDEVAARLRGRGGRQTRLDDRLLQQTSEQKGTALVRSYTKLGQHTVSITPQGWVIRCSICRPIREEFAFELASNPKLARRVFEVEDLALEASQMGNQKLAQEAVEKARVIADELERVRRAKDVRLYRGVTKGYIDDVYFLDRRLVVDMPFVGTGKSNVNAAGWLRDSNYYWKEIALRHPEAFSPSNLQRINGLPPFLKPFSPVNDSAFRGLFPQYDVKGLRGKPLIHHHIAGGGQAAAVPSPLHPGFGGIHTAEKAIGIWGKENEISKVLQRLLENIKQ